MANCYAECELFIGDASTARDLGGVRFLPVIVLVCMLGGCSNGYESDNRAIVAELPTVSGIELIEEDHYGYCSADTCLLGNDRSGALLTYAVDTEQLTMMALAEAYRASLDGWTANVGEACANADSSFCDEIVFASFVRGDAVINLNFDNWPAGRFELHVDAEGAR